MTTGDSFSRFNPKGLVNYEDWDTYFMTYLRNATRDSVITKWGSQRGTLDVALGLSGGVDAIVVTGTSWQTDGLGNVLEFIATATLGSPFKFQNTIGVTYYVGNFYSEFPSDIRPSPRTGLIQYARMTEAIGRSGNPDAVVNNGSNLTFTVDSVTEAGVTNAGRTIRVFKKVPGINATTMHVAVEDCIVAFTGGANKITTSGLFGQAGTPSTTPADYTVICLGPAITVGNLTATSGCAFIGTVVGVGAGNTPVSFSTSLQPILKSQNDASMITYTPGISQYWPNPIPTTSQQALDRIAEGLLEASRWANNFLYKGDIGSPAAATKLKFAYDKNAKAFFTVNGVGAVNPHWFYSRDSGLTWTDGGAIAATTLQTSMVYYDPLGGAPAAIAGLVPSGATASKLLYANAATGANPFSSWTLQALATSSTAAVTAISSNGSMKLVGLSDGSFQRTTAGWTSGWAAVTGANANSVDQLVNNGSTWIAISRINTNKIQRSIDNGATWSEITLPATKNIHGVAYDTKRARFVITTKSDLVFISADGSSWATSGTGAPALIGDLCNWRFGAILLAVASGTGGSPDPLERLVYSLDGGDTWLNGVSLAGTWSDIGGLAVGDGQWLAGRVSDGVTFAGARFQEIAQ